MDLCFGNLCFLIIEQVRRAGSITKENAVYLDRQEDPGSDFYSYVKRRLRESLPLEKNFVIAERPAPVPEGGVRDNASGSPVVVVGTNTNGTNGVAGRGGEPHIIKGDADPSPRGSSKNNIVVEQDPSSPRSSSSSSFRSATSDPTDVLDPNSIQSLDKYPVLPIEKCYLGDERRLTAANWRLGLQVRRGLNWIYGDEDMKLVGVVVGGFRGGSPATLGGCALAPGGGDLCQREAEQPWVDVLWFQAGGIFASEKRRVCRYFRLGPEKFDLALVFKDEAL